MLRFGFLAKKLTRSFLDSAPKGKDINLFISNIDINKYSIPRLALSLKISKDNQQEKIHEETVKRLYQIRDKIEKNLDKLDPQSIVYFCEWIGKSNLLDNYSLPKSYKNELILRITELLSAHSFDRRQILTIYENLSPQGFRIDKLLYEVKKIVDDASNLNLEEISQIITGSNTFIFSRDSNFFYICMNRIFELSNQEELDEKCLVKILNPLANKLEKRWFKLYFEKFAKIIESTLPRWKENDLLSIIKLYKNNNDIDKNLYDQTLKLIYELLSKEQKLEFVIKLISLLKDENKGNKKIKEILVKSLEIINSKLSGEFVGVENLINMLEFMKPIIDSRTANLLKHQINRNDIYFNKMFNLLQKASWISVNNGGKLFLLTDTISFNCKYDQHFKSLYKLEILYLITNTKNYNDLHDLKEIKKNIINSLKIWIDLSNENTKDFCLLIDKMSYSSEFVKALKPLQDIFYNSLKKQIASKYSLYYSMMLYECDPEKWENFVKENKRNFTDERILSAIRFHKGPFQAIIFLLNIYEHNLSIWSIGAAMQKIIEVQDVKVLNNFARILNTIDPHFLLNDVSIYSRYDCFNHLLEYSDFSLLTDLFSKAQELLKNLSIDTIFSNNNIKMLCYTAKLGNLDSDLAYLVISNYKYMKISDSWSIFTISSKCSDTNLREGVIKDIINDKLEPLFLKTIIQRYIYHPKNKEIDNYIIRVLNNIIVRSGIKGIITMKEALWTYFGEMKSNHPELLNAILNLTKDMVLKNIRSLKFEDLNGLRELFIRNNDSDFAKIIWSRLLNIVYYRYNKMPQESLTKKISVELSDKERVLSACNKDDNFSLAYLAQDFSDLADFGTEKEERANEMAKKIINYTENNEHVFESDFEYTNWIWGLVRFNASKSIVMRHLENSKYFEIKKLIFRHFLLANHFSMDPDYKGVNIFEQKTDKYWRDFNYFKHFGIDKFLISNIKSKFKQENIEVKSGEFIDGIWVPFYIPHRKAAFWPETSSILLYKSGIFRGEFAMYQKQLRKKLEDLIILNKSEIDNGIEKIDLKKILNT